MKKIVFVAFATLSVILVSCKPEKPTPTPVVETEGLTKVQEMSDDTYTVEIYTKTGAFQLGYNAVYLCLKDKATGNYKQNVTFSWSPLMKMMSMEHACPKSDIKLVANKLTLYSGYLVFQMPENTDEHWKLTVNYTVDGANGSVTSQISVPNSTNKNVVSFTGSDSKKYILALIEPQKPAVTQNDMVFGLFQMENMMSFPIVKNYSIAVDPRMPDMGNHSSPNNVNPVYSSTDDFYHGKLSLTMTGMWRLNFIVKNDADEVLKGEAVDGETGSSLYLDINL